MIFDTHVHYNSDAFSEDRDAVIHSLQAAGVGTVVNIASDIDSLTECRELGEKYPFLYYTLGIHPSDCGSMTAETLQQIRIGLLEEKAVAVGEIGLDYYWPQPDRQTQQHWFRQQLRLAAEMRKPVVIHSRNAAEDTLQILQEEHGGANGGVIHCYSYSREMAVEFVKMGFHIGVGGVVTFSNSKRIKKVVQDIPIENIVLETDAPYLAPVPFRGKRNTSALLPYVVEAIAELKGMEAEDVIRITEENARRMYRITA